MEDERGWLFRPVTRGWLRPESLVDGTVDLELIGLLHEAMDVEAENQRRIDEWQRSK